MTVIPNPLTPASQVRFHLPESDDVIIRILAGNGQTVLTLFNGKLAQGDHQIMLSSPGLSTSGVYFIDMEGKKFTAVCKAVRM